MWSEVEPSGAGSPSAWAVASAALVIPRPPYRDQPDPAAMEEAFRTVTSALASDVAEALGGAAAAFEHHPETAVTNAPEAGRDRSPLSASRPRDSTNPDVKSPIDPVAAAAAAATRINAQVQGRKSTHGDSPSNRAGSASVRDASAPPANINGEMYTSDGDFIKDVLFSIDWNTMALPCEMPPRDAERSVAGAFEHHSAIR
ncbi:hypothetical protein V8F20_008094 [Naviculisporaceae sp. PSN 640]